VRHHHCRGAQQLLRRQSSTLDGGMLKVARCSSAARSTVWCARRRCARRFLARLTCFTEPRSSPSSLDAAVITASLSVLCVPVGGRQLCTSRIIYLRVAGPAVTSVGTSSRILRLRSSRPPHPPTTHPGPGALPPIYKHHALKRTPLVRLFSIKLRTIYLIRGRTWYAVAHTMAHTRPRGLCEGSHHFTM
jgi:hypothetical protein